MNKQSLFAVSRPVFNRFLFLLIASASTYAAQAQYTDTIDQGITAVTIKSAGFEDNMYLLQVEVSNEEGKDFCIAVSESGNDHVLYEKVYNDKQFTKLFKMPANKGTLNFTITDLTSFSARSFTIDTNVQPSENAVAKEQD